MKKILIILTGVLLVWNEPVIAKNATSNINTLKVTKKAKKKAKKVVKKTSQKKKKVKSVKKKVIKSKKSKKSSYRVRHNVGEIQSYIHQKIYEYGWTENDYYSIVQIVNRESSFNPYAVNKKSGACGLFQSYPCSKMAKYGKDYRTNYKVQVSWGMDYIKARYGTPQNAWSFWQKHHWY